MRKSNLALILACCILLACFASCNWNQELPDEGDDIDTEPFETQPIVEGETEETQSGNAEVGEPFEFLSNGDGTCIVTGLAELEKGALVIPEKSPNGEKVVGIADEAFKNWAGVTDVTIPEGVTSIGVSAFSLCSRLVTISFPKSLTDIGASAFYGCASLENVVIPEGVEKIEKDTFSSCSGLKSVVLPASIKSIGSNAFSSAVFEEVPLVDEDGAVMLDEDGNQVGSLVYVGNWLIKCSYKSVEYVDIKDDTIGIADGAFKNCNKLESLDIPDSVKYIHRNAFEGCSALLKEQKENNVSLNVVDGVLYVDNWAITSKNAARVNKVTLREGTVGIVGGLFTEFTKVQQIVIPASVISIDDEAFKNCVTLKSIKVSQDNPAYKDVDGNLYTKDGKNLIQFAPENAIESIAISKDVVSIKKYAFMGCPNLKNIIVDENNPNYSSIDGNLYSKDGKTLIAYASGKVDENGAAVEFVVPDQVIRISPLAFYMSENLSKLTVNFIGASKYLSEDNRFAYIFGASVIAEIEEDEFESVVKDVIPKSLTKVTIKGNVETISECAFMGCENINSIILPETVTVIEQSAFSGCKKLSDIKIPASVKIIGDKAFNACSSIKEIVIPDGILEIGLSVFAGCSKIEKLTMPYMGWEKLEDTESVTEADESETGAADTEEAVTGEDGSVETEEEEETIDKKNSHIGYLFGSVKDSSGKFNNSSVPKSLKYVEVKNGDKITDKAFAGCSSIVEIKLPATVTEIGEGAFLNCSNLESLNIPEGVTTIGESAFSGCSSLTTFVIPEGVTTIGYATFAGCVEFTSIKIPKNVTTIGYNAFDGCVKLESVEIGASVTTIEMSAFKGCVALKSVTIPSSVVSIEMYAFADCSSLNDVTFANTEGWKAGEADIASASLANANTAATYIVDNYSHVGWTCIK